MVAYVVEAVDDVTPAPGSPADGMDLMSPYVWRESDHYRIMVRVLAWPLGPDDATGTIYAGTSDDGLIFTLSPKPAISPGPDDVDAGGCEDPTVVGLAKGGYAVFYTGVDSKRDQGSMLVAAGPDIDHLTKRAVLLKAPAGEGNIKEATVAQASDGSWRLFYEYAKDGASRIGIASSPTEHGPWTPQDDPFDVRPDGWDNWHLSTGPMLMQDGRDPVMFYNGATGDARWRIGWISFSPDFSRVTGRGIEPILMPPPPRHRASTDIAFAASVVIDGDAIWLYYSLEDRRLSRATIAQYDDGAPAKAPPPKPATK